MWKNEEYCQKSGSNKDNQRRANNEEREDPSLLIPWLLISPLSSHQSSYDLVIGNLNILFSFSNFLKKTHVMQDITNSLVWLTKHRAVWNALLLCPHWIAPLTFHISTRGLVLLRKSFSRSANSCPFFKCLLGNFVLNKVSPELPR